MLEPVGLTIPRALRRATYMLRSCPVMSPCDEEEVIRSRDFLGSFLKLRVYDKINTRRISQFLGILLFWLRLEGTETCIET